MAKLGDPITKKLVTGRLFVKRTGETNYIDLGNVVDHKFDPQIGRADHNKSSKGYKQKDFSLVKSVELKYTLTLDEQSDELRKLMALGTAAADVVQAGGNVAAEVLTATSKQGRTYFALAQGLSAYAVKVAAAVKTEGVDYTIDAGSGAVTILAGGGIVDGSNVTIDYTKAAVTTSPVTALKELRATATFKLIEFDQFSDIPRAVHDFDGQYQVTGWGENNTDDYNKPQIEVLCITNPVVTYRKD